METFKEMEDRFTERYEKDHNIFCPYCGEKQSEETISEHTSYNGEKEDQEKVQICEECGEEFIVEERVDRTFETTKK